MGKSFVSTFLYDCELHFNDKDGNSTEIMKECVKYILISHDYKSKIMPVIYLKANITPSIYNKMVPQQGTSKIVLKLSLLDLSNLLLLFIILFSSTFTSEVGLPISVCSTF